MAGTVPISRVGQCVTTTGFVTILRNIVVAPNDPVGIAATLGFGPGSFGEGYWLLVMARHGHVPADGFRFAGYTNSTGGVVQPTGETIHDAFSERYSDHPIDRAQRAGVLADAHRRLNAAGLDRVARVVAVGRRPSSYVPGHGVPQFVLTRPVPFDVVARVAPGQRVVADRTGAITVRPDTRRDPSARPATP
ncbi:MAG: hypothetical protein ACU0CO_16790 [Shimia sp.]